MAKPGKPQHDAVIRDMQHALDTENYVYALRLINANPSVAAELRAMWQQKADEEWERELAEDLDNDAQELAQAQQEAQEAA